MTARRGDFPPRSSRKYFRSSDREIRSHRRSSINLGGFDPECVPTRTHARADDRCTLRLLCCISQLLLGGRNRGAFVDVESRSFPRHFISLSLALPRDSKGWLGDNKLETIRRARARAQHEHAFSFKARDTAESRRCARKTIS